MSATVKIVDELGIESLEVMDLRETGKMDYLLTEHAREVLERRQILHAWVERALSAPEAVEADPIDPDLEHRLLRIPEFGNRVLRVVVNAKSAPLRIVTAFLDRRRTIP